MTVTTLEQAIAPYPEGTYTPITDPESIETRENAQKRFREGLVRRQQGRQARLKPMLLELRRHFHQIDADARRKHLQQIATMFRYYDGDMYETYDEVGNLRDDRQDGDFAYSIPVMSGHVGEAFMQLMKVKPDFIISANNTSDDNHNRLARMCELLGKENLDRLMKEDERQTEVLNSILAGDSHREIFWSVNPKAPKTAKRVRQKPVKFELPGRRECLNCKAEVAEGVETCPSCGVSGIRDIPAGAGTRFEAEEYEVELGENCLRIPHPMGMQSDLSALKFEDSTHIIEHDFLEKHVASWAYQTPIEPNDLGMSPEMQARHNLERSSVQMDAIVGSARQWGRGFNGRKVERERHFWDVTEYGWIYCEVEEPLPNPIPDPANPEKFIKAIPADTLLGDFFSKGVYVTYMGDTIVQIEPCVKRRRWVKVQYGKRPGSSVGMGAKLLAMLNDIVNDDYNLYHAVKSTSARPFTVVTGAVKLLPEAGHFLRIDRLPPGVRDIKGAVQQYPGQSVAGMDATAQTIQQAMQFIFGSYTLGAGGAPDMQKFGGTATEVTARVEQASGRQIGPIGQMIAGDKETILICLENTQEFSTKEQKAELAKRFGPDITELFFTTNLRQVVSVGIKPNTDIPRSLAMTQAGRLAFTQAAAELVPLAAEVPWVMEFLEDMADTYGFPLSIGKGRSDRREAEYRLNKLAGIEERAMSKNPQVMNDPMQAAKLMYTALAEMCGPFIAPEENEEDDVPRLFLQDHDTFMDAYKDALLGEEAKAYSQARRLVIIKIWEDHFFAKVGQQIEMAKIQTRLQQEMNPPPPTPSPEELAAAQGQERQAAMEEEAMARAADEQAKDADLERQEAAKGADHQRKLEATEHGAATQIAVETAKQAMRPKDEKPKASSKK